MSKLRIGIVGCGGIAKQKHLPSLQACADLCEMTAFCDIIVERAEKAKAEYGTGDARVYTDYHQLVKDAGVDIVHVLTPNVSHSPIAVAAFQAGKHVMCEKPMAHTSADAQKMMDFLGIEPPAPLQVAEAKAEADQQAAFVREFDVLLQRDYDLTIEDAGLATSDVLRYRDAGSATDAVREYADDYGLQQRGPLDPRPSPEIERELATLRAQRDQLKSALQGVLAAGEPEVETHVRQAVKP